MDSRPIGIFDSGLGGLTCIPSLKSMLPAEHVVYFGDTARTPYGSKSVETIRRFSKDIVDFLLSKKAKLIMIACNTVSSVCLPWLSEEYPDIPFVGVIDPVSRFVSNELHSGKIAVIGTKVTVESRVYPRKLPSFEVAQKACPLFVPLIEEGLLKHRMMEEAIHYYLDDFIGKGRFSCTILGCTHYHLLEERLRTLYPETRIINPSRSMAAEVRRILVERGQLAEADHEAADHFYASDLSENYLRMIGEILGSNPGNIRFKNLDM